MGTLAPIHASISKVADVLEGLELNMVEMSTLDMLGVDLANAANEAHGPSFVTIAALAWLQARRTTHPDITWEDAEPLLLIAVI